MSDVHDRIVTWYLWMFRLTLAMFVVSLAFVVVGIIRDRMEPMVILLPLLIALVANSNRLALERLKRTGNPWKPFLD